MRKTQEGRQHPDRDGQFQHIATTAGDPVIFVDARKKELIGDFRNGGREWQPKDSPEAALVHDFPDPELGKVAPYGVCDIATNQGWVSVGIDHDTAAFAVERDGTASLSECEAPAHHERTAVGAMAIGFACGAWEECMESERRERSTTTLA